MEIRMKNKMFAGLAAGLLLVGMAGGVNATIITFGGDNLDGIKTSSVIGAQVETFNNALGEIGFLTGSLDQLWAWEGDATVFQSPSGTSSSASPYGDTSNYLSVPIQLGLGL